MNKEAMEMKVGILLVLDRDKGIGGSSLSHCKCQRCHCPKISNVLVQPTQMYVSSEN